MGPIEKIGWVGFSAASSVACLFSALFAGSTLRRSGGAFVMSARPTLQRVWLATRLGVGAVGLNFLIFFPFVAASDAAFAQSVDFYAFLFAGAEFVAVLVLWATPRRRGKLLQRINNFFAPVISSDTFVKLLGQAA